VLQMWNGKGKDCREGGQGVDANQNCPTSGKRSIMHVPKHAVPLGKKEINTNPRGCVRWGKRILEGGRGRERGT